VRNNADSKYTAKIRIHGQFKALVTAEMDGKMCLIHELSKNTTEIKHIYT